MPDRQTLLARLLGRLPIQEQREQFGVELQRPSQLPKTPNQGDEERQKEKDNLEETIASVWRDAEDLLNQIHGSFVARVTPYLDMSKAFLYAVPLATRAREYSDAKVPARSAYGLAL